MSCDASLQRVCRLAKRAALASWAADCAVLLRCSIRRLTYMPTSDAVAKCPWIREIMDNAAETRRPLSLRSFAPHTAWFFATCERRRGARLHRTLDPKQQTRSWGGESTRR